MNVFCSRKGLQDHILVFILVVAVLGGIALLVNYGGTPTGAIVISPTGNLTCNFVQGTSCPGLFFKAYALSNGTNAHVELFNESNYNISVCCQDAIMASTLFPGVGTNLFNLSNFTNAHAGLSNTPYAIPVSLGSSGPSINCFVNS